MQYTINACTGFFVGKKEFATEIWSKRRRAKQTSISFFCEPTVIPSPSSAARLRTGVPPGERAPITRFSATFKHEGVVTPAFSLSAPTRSRPDVRRRLTPLRSLREMAPCRPAPAAFCKVNASEEHTREHQWYCTRQQSYRCRFMTHSRSRRLNLVEFDGCDICQGESLSTIG